MSRQFRILALITLITVINYLDRSAISFAILPLEQQFQLNDAEFGLILSSFGLGCLLMSFFSGILLDRLGSIALWSVGAACWSLCTMAFAISKGFWSLLTLRFLLGILEALHFPALLKTIADWLKPSIRASAISIGLLGVPAASLIGAPLLTSILTFLSWQWMFIILALSGLAWALVWPLVFRHKKNPHYISTQAFESFDLPHQAADFKKMFQNPTFLGNCIAYFSFGCLVFFALLWLPGYMEKELKFSIQSTGTLLMIPWGVSTVLLLLGGLVSDWIYRKTRSKRKSRTFFIAGGLFSAGLCFLFLSFTTSQHLCIALLSLGLGLGFFTNSPLYALNADLFPHHPATAQGIMTVFFSLAGLVAPSLTGFMVQWSGAFQSAFFMVASLCIFGSLFALAVQKD